MEWGGAEGYGDHVAFVAQAKSASASSSGQPLLAEPKVRGALCCRSCGCAVNRSRGWRVVSAALPPIWRFSLLLFFLRTSFIQFATCEAGCLSRPAASTRIPLRAGPLVRTLGVPRSDPPCAPVSPMGRGAAATPECQYADISAALAYEFRANWRKRKSFQSTPRHAP
jgi:hypothetical protein